MALLNAFLYGHHSFTTYSLHIVSGQENIKINFAFDRKMQLCCFYVGLIKLPCMISFFYCTLEMLDSADVS